MTVATLTEDEKSVSLILARWNVSGQSGADVKGSSVVRFRGEQGNQRDDQRVCKRPVAGFREVGWM